MSTESALKAALDDPCRTVMSRDLALRIIRGDEVAIEWCQAHLDALEGAEVIYIPDVPDQKEK